MIVFFALFAFIVLLLFSFWLFSRLSAKKPELYVASGSSLERSLLANISCLNEVYYPTWWCPFGHLQTAGQILRDCPRLPFERELVTLNDGGVVAVDWLSPSEGCSSDTPIVIFLPGITGSTNDCAYILHSVRECIKLGYRAVVMNARGIGGVILMTPQTYNAAWIHDLRHVVRLVSSRYQKAPKIGVGFSMGGMVLWNYLADSGTAEACDLKGALCVSSPFNPVETSLSIERFFPRLVFNSHLTDNLKRLVSPYKTLFEGRCNWEEVMSCRTVRGFDIAFTVPIFGYKDWVEYYHAAAPYWKTHKIPVPTVCLNAEDDCFSPVNAIPFTEIKRNKNVAVVLTRHGGHTAFMRGTSPSSLGLAEEVISQFAKMIFTTS